MKNSTRVSRDVFTFGRGNRSLYVTATFVVGLLFVAGMLFSNSSISNSRVQAQSAAEFQGGATAEMLAYALNFGAASDLAVFGGRAVRNHGTSSFRGRVGSTGQVIGVPNLTENASPESFGQAKQDMKDALRWIAQLPCADVAETNLGGKTFTPGVYCLPSAELAGQMTLSGGGDSNARFIFRIAGGVSASAESNIRLLDGARATNVYFVSGGDVTIGRDSTINANIISNNTVSIGTGSTMAAKTVGLEGEITIETSNLGAGTGSIEICKVLAAGDPIPVGTIFNFNVSGIATPVQVPAGSCSNAFDVAAGNVTVTEQARANTAVTSIVTNPATRRVSFNLATQQVVVAVPEGNVNDETVITFTNQTTRTGTIEICKRALDSDVTGFFQYTVQGAPGQTFSVPVGGCSPAITTTILQAPNTAFTANVTELARANYRLENVTTFPANRLVAWFPNLGFDANGNAITNTNGGYANVTLISGGNVNQQTTVNFFNRSLPGQIKVCKITADPTNIPQGTLFRFTVSGLAPTSPTQTLPGVGVTRTVDVPAGPDAQGGFCVFVEGTFVVGEPVLVTETGLTPGQTLPGGLTFADTRVSRIRASTALSPAGTTVQTAGGPVTGPTPNPNLALRMVAFPARNTTAIVDFTNYVFRPSILKICKIAGTGVTVGTPFTFNVALVNPLTSLPIPASSNPVTVLAGSCEFAQGPFPANDQFPGIGTFNFGTQILVTETAVTGVGVTAVTSPTGGTITSNLPGRAGTITLNQSLLPNNLFNEIAFTNTATAVTPPAAAARFDFDGDRISDEVIYRPASGTWWYSASTAGGAARAVQFGIATDRLVAADYDGDGKTDFAVYRGNGEWHVLGSSTGYSVRVFGLSGDIPQPGDYDGDGKADLAVYRPSDGTWYLQQSSAGFSAIRFGNSTDSPQAADFDGDRRMDVAVYRGGTWYILGSTSGFTALQFGLAGDRPVPADYDGDGRADVAVYRAGVWHILKTTSGYVASQFGMASDIPVPADYDGDGRTDMAVYRSSDNVWHVMRSSQAESGYSAMQFGTGGDVLLSY
ncbi:MAG TPA: ice-binding family protein [Pyrinomonadaceae bacterium]|nr:ice-binding family protein [Pyrinomonadaceae bacterium]